MAQSITDGTSERRSWNHCSKTSLQPTVTADFQLRKYVFELGSSGGSAVKNPPANAGNVGSISGSGRSPGEGNGNPL